MIFDKCDTFSITVLMDIECRRSICFKQFQAAYSDHFSHFFAQKYSSFEQKVAKNDHCASK